MKMTQFLQLMLLLLLLPFIFLSSTVISTVVVDYLPGYQGHLPLILETEYAGVGESEKVQLFYYFVESERVVVTDALMLWLTSVPGCSAFIGLVFEIVHASVDEYMANYLGLDQSKYQWALNDYYQAHPLILLVICPMGDEQI